MNDYEQKNNSSKAYFMLFLPLTIFLLGCWELFFGMYADLISNFLNFLKPKYNFPTFLSKIKWNVLLFLISFALLFLAHLKQEVGYFKKIIDAYKVRVILIPVFFSWGIYLLSLGILGIFNLYEGSTSFLVVGGVMCVGLAYLFLITPIPSSVSHGFLSKFLSKLFKKFDE